MKTTRPPKRRDIDVLERRARIIHQLDDTIKHGAKLEERDDVLAHLKITDDDREWILKEEVWPRRHQVLSEPRGRTT
ncbi:MAG: hypothetical protein KY455_10235 [Euryarchaeota archaeon]|nr:hypothetical protein [Euryarchaeota archaeon]